MFTFHVQYFYLFFFCGKLVFALLILPRLNAVLKLVISRDLILVSKLLVTISSEGQLKSVARKVLGFWPLIFQKKIVNQEIILMIGHLKRALELFV